MQNFFKNLFGTGDENEGFNDYEDEEYGGYDTSSSAVTEEEASYSPSYSAPSSNFSSSSTSRAISFHNGSVGQSKIVIMKPSSYEEVMTDAIARLREGTIIFLNLNGIDKEKGTRIVDFLTGAVAMCDGRIKSVDDKTGCYAIAPKNVEWVGIIED